jgi:hypothetical protein
MTALFTFDESMDGELKGCGLQSVHIPFAGLPQGQSILIGRELIFKGKGLSDTAA